MTAYEYFVIFLVLLSLVSCQEESLFSYKQFTEHIEASFRNSNDSSTCREQLKELWHHKPQALWDLFDSTSKFPWSGLSTGSFKDWGNYDQCLNIKHDYSNGTITGKYCLFGAILPTKVDNKTFYQLGLCMPKDCSAEDYTSIFLYKGFNNFACHTKEYLDKYTTGDYVMIVVLSCFAAIMIISTVYDVYLFKTERKSPNPMFVAFSVFTNGRKLFKTSKGNKDQIQVFNGFKTISMCWIIAGHAFGSWNKYALINRDIVEHYLSYLRVAYISGSVLAVDTFFFMSGFLLTYIYLKQKTKPLILQIKAIPYLIFHRYVRLTPPVIMLYFFSLTIYKHTGSGPLWKEGMESISKPCRKYPWPFFTYIQNYYNYDDLCWFHTWYLSADMQMFIVSLIILIPSAVLLGKSSKNLKKVMIIMALVNVLFIVLPMTLKLVFTYNNTYDTHGRVSCYTLGMMLGMFIRETKDKPFFFGKMAKLRRMNLIIWAFALFLMFTVILVQQEIAHNGYDHVAVAITESLQRPAWGLGLCWIVYSCYYGYGGFVNWILTRPILQIIAKLSYCMYLVHALVISHYVCLTRTRVWFNDYIAFFNWCSFFLITLLVSIIWSLAFESPVIIIEKLIFGGNTRKPRQKRPSENIDTGNYSQKH